MSDSNLPAPPPAKLQPVVVICLTIAFLATIGAYVWMSHEGTQADGLISAVLIILSAVGVSTHVETRTRRQDRMLSTITHQTNGALDRRIRDGVREVVAAELDARNNT